MKKSGNQHKILDLLEILAPSMPGPIYWKSLNSVYLGMNEFTLKFTGIKNFDSFIGKTDYELWPQFADEIVKNDQEVIHTGKPLYKEETIKFDDNQIKYFTVVKIPLRNDDGEIIGVIGNSIDITAEKEAKRLELENMQLKLEVQNKLIEAQTNFHKLVGQMIHDIQSPIASMRMFLYSATYFEESKRVLLRQITDRISDITQDMLNHYKPAAAPVSDHEVAESLLLSTTVSEIISEKRFQFKNYGVKIELKPQEREVNQFAFINVGPRNFKRMISNLINNAVEAFTMIDSDSLVTIEYNIINHLVSIIIQDNGKGIPADLLTKIRNGLAITHDKIDGHGLGLTQVQNTINLYNGTLEINSSTNKNHGTTIIITFPQIDKPDWINDEIHFSSNDTVIILDDDNSIHGAWDTKLLNIVKQNPNLKIMHFTSGVEVLKHFFMMSSEEKDNFYLLSDYELLNQPCNGLEIIQKTQVKRATLVTSHYANAHIREIAKQQQIKILPKELVPIVPVKLN